MDQITFEDFKKLEIKIGTIQKAEPIIGSEKLMGLESQGMILAADVNKKTVLLHPDQEIPPGSTIR